MPQQNLHADRRGAYILEGLAFFVFVLGPIVGIGLYGQVLLGDIYQYGCEMLARPFP